jgi:hypothetical protein
VLFPVILMVALWSPDSALTPRISDENKNTQCDSVLKAELSWETANLHHDGAALSKLLSPEFVQINEDGSVTSRDEAIAKLQASGNQPKEYKIEDRNIRVYGHVAILTAQYTEIGQSPRGYYRVVLKIADVFRYSQGVWKGEVGYAHLVDLKSSQPSPLPLNEH